MRIFALGVMAAFALSTAACAEPAGTAASPTQAASTEGAEAFVRALYGSYSEAVDANPWGGDQAFSHRLNALMARDVELSGDELPYLDADPVCNCQDWENLSVRSVRLASAPGGAVDATVQFINAGEESTNVLRLVRQASGWRIDDIVYPETGSGLAAALAESNARIEAGGKALYRD